jgi:hypothetical protein
MDAAESPEDMIPLPQAKMELDQPDPRDVDWKDCENMSDLWV